MCWVSKSWGLNLSQPLQPGEYRAQAGQAWAYILTSRCGGGSAPKLYALMVEKTWVPQEN